MYQAYRKLVNVMKHLLFIGCRRVQNLHAMQTCKTSSTLLAISRWSYQYMCSLHRRYADLWTSLSIVLLLLR